MTPFYVARSHAVIMAGVGSRRPEVRTIVSGGPNMLCAQCLYSLLLGRRFDR